MSKRVARRLNTPHVLRSPAVTPSLFSFCLSPSLLLFSSSIYPPRLSARSRSSLGPVWKGGGEHTCKDICYAVLLVQKYLSSVQLGCNFRDRKWFEENAPVALVTTKALKLESCLRSSGVGRPKLPLFHLAH